MIQVYTGNGKGKTTAAVGLACRAAGHGKRVVFIQFLKADATRAGEFAVLSALDGVEVLRFGDSMLGARPTPPDEVGAAVRAGLAAARRLLEEKTVDVLVLDEGNVACLLGLVEAEELVEAIRPADADVEVIVTGRGAPPELVALADLVTEMVPLKHPYENGAHAREGVEF